MADPTEFHDWELLRPSSPTANPFDLAGAINPEYFSLSSAPFQADRTTTVHVSEEPGRSGRIDSDYADHPESQRGSEFSIDFSSEGSSFLTEGEKGETLVELGFEGASTGVIFQEEEAKAIDEIDDPTDFSSVGSSSLLDIEIRALDRELGLAFEGIGKSCEEEDGIEGCEVKSEESTVEGEMKEMSDRNGEKKLEGWWKLPIEVLKFYVLKTRPVWSVTIAAAIVGVVLLGRRLYRMKQRNKSVSLKSTFEDKKTSLLMALAANLNEAFSVMKRAPIIRPTAPAGGLTPWPLLGLAFT